MLSYYLLLVLLLMVLKTYRNMAAKWQLLETQQKNSAVRFSVLQCLFLIVALLVCGKVAYAPKRDETPQRQLLGQLPRPPCPDIVTFGGGRNP